MKPLILPLFTPGHLVSAVRLLVPVYIETPRTRQGVTRQQTWFTWSCSCGEVSPTDFRASHEHLAEDAGRRHSEPVAA